MARGPDAIGQPRAKGETAFMRTLGFAAAYQLIGRLARLRYDTLGG